MAPPQRLVPLLEQFIDTVWWVNQEVLHHGAEIALLRDLYRAQHAGDPGDPGGRPSL